MTIPLSSKFVAGQALSDADWRAAFTVRHAAFCATGDFDCSRPAWAEHDRWDTDPGADLYLVRHAGVPVGSARVVLGRGASGLPLSVYRTIAEEEMFFLAEICKAGLDPSWRGDRAGALLALFGAMIQDLRRRGCLTIVVGMRAPMALLLARRGAVPFDVDLVVPRAFANGEPAFFGRARISDIAALQRADRPHAHAAVFGHGESPVARSDDELDPLREVLRRSVATIIRALHEDDAGGGSLASTTPPTLCAVGA